MLSDDELFVVRALSTKYGDAWKEGEDPPDAYFIYQGSNIAVEISTLTQNVINENGACIPRLSQDIPGLRLCEGLENEVGNCISKGFYLIITISAPIDRLRKFERELGDYIKSNVQHGMEFKRDIEILGRNVELHMVRGYRDSGKRIVGIISNPNASADIFESAKLILSKIISEKVIKCKNVSNRPLWLVLFNDYWLASIDCYRSAYQALNVDHEFDNILIVDGAKNIHELVST